MKGFNQVVKELWAMLFLSAIVISCAAIPQLRARYELPAPSKHLQGMTAVLSVKDVREVPTVLGRGAKGEFHNFSGTISLNIVRHDGTGLEMGIYSPADMLREALGKRLETENMTVLPESSRTGPRLQVLLKRFALDLVDGKWVASMSYDANIFKDGHLRATQSVEGQAERFRLLGRGGADKAMGEIFTDMVNRLDVSGLFRKAGLIKS